MVAAYEAGKGTYRELAGLFGVGEASVKRWVLTVEINRPRKKREPLTFRA